MSYYVIKEALKRHLTAENSDALEEVEKYLLEHEWPVRFVFAVLTNNLISAVELSASHKVLAQVVACLHDCKMPHAWGSRDAVADWLREHELHDVNGRAVTR